MDGKTGGRNRYVLISLISAALLILITVLSIKWPGKNSPIGKEYTSHIYVNSSFRLLSVSVNSDSQIFSFNYDSRYNDTFTFEFDPDAGSYVIYKMFSDVPMYLEETADHELHMNESPSGESSRWRLVRLGNTMYFMIINEESGYALYETEDDHAILLPADENDINMHMRLM